MTVLVYMIPISLILGLGFLGAFLWAIENDQMQNLDDKSLLAIEIEQEKEKR